MSTAAAASKPRSSSMPPPDFDAAMRPAKPRAITASVAMIDTVIVEVPNPRHPYGVRGVGETPIVPPMAAIANALEQAIGIRFTELPMSPPKVLKAIEAARADGGE